MLEGTRNERVVILIISYVIGFITAYVAFGVIEISQSIDITHQSSTVINTQHQDNVTDVFVKKNTYGLFVIKDNEYILLSVTDAENASIEGAHVDIIQYLLSPDKTQIYFCELPYIDSSTCRPYIYSINDAIVRPVLLSGERVDFRVLNHSVSWSQYNELIIK